uniref:Granzyme B-like n=1 Tax=Pundamilia nyererei TaxID=303518 RepID=A0A3B4FF76_9CICH
RGAVSLLKVLIIFLPLMGKGAAESGIVGGREAKPHSRPYMVSVQYRGVHSCGGILIQRDFVLTAAHCKYTWGSCTVVLGAHDITKKERTQQRIEVDEYFAHPGFTGNLNNDIMLLKLKKNATLNKYVRTIGLPKKNGETPANIKCAVAGWGLTRANGSRSSVLKEATEKMQFSTECKHIWQKHFNSGHMICTKFTRRDGGVCQGDSGGPLICNTKPQGITAFIWGEDCNNPQYPHVYTKVSSFIPWIKQTMEEQE